MLQLPMSDRLLEHAPILFRRFENALSAWALREVLSTLLVFPFLPLTLARRSAIALLSPACDHGSFLSVLLLPRSFWES